MPNTFKRDMSSEYRWIRSSVLLFGLCSGLLQSAPMEGINACHQSDARNQTASVINRASRARSGGDLKGQFQNKNAQQAAASIERGGCLTIDPKATIDRLENVRNNIVFTELSEEDKQTIANQASLILNGLYVNIRVKMAHYGHDIDPTPKIAAIVNNAKQMSTKQLHEEIYKLFVSLRDRHLVYTFPRPYSDYISFLPLTFDDVIASNNQRKVLVSSVNTDIFAQYLSGCRVPSLGDEVIEFNGKTINEAIDEEAQVCQGSNQAAYKERALIGLTFRAHAVNLLPNENEVSLKFKTNTGEIYTANMKWLCEISPYANVSNNIDASDSASSNDQIVRSVFMKNNNLVPREQPFPIQVYSDYLNCLSWGSIQNNYGNFGYIKLSSFDTDSDAVIMAVQKIINNNFGDTKGLVFDVRDNAGGSADLAEKLVQLFAPQEVETVDTRILNSPLNQKLLTGFFGMQNFQWQDALSQVAGTKAHYSAFNKIVYDANDIGQIYSKPVAVFTNASSYSASDIFACDMQDNNAAVIWGEDPTTGAGGASVMTQSVLAQQASFTFKKMNGVSMRFPWTQIVRIGKNKGKLIENSGCFSDKIAQKTPSDIIDGGVSQFDKITRDLAERSNNSNE